MRQIDKRYRTIYLKLKQFKWLFPLKVLEVSIQLIMSKIPLKYKKFSQLGTRLRRIKYPILCEQPTDPIKKYEPNMYPIFNRWVNVKSKNNEIMWNYDFIYDHVYARKEIKNGVTDIKVPWELGRFSYFAKLSAIKSKDYYITARTFEHFVKSFIENNGNTKECVQWANAMEAGIRISNILIAYSNYINNGIDFNQEFEDEVASLALMHRNYILFNLEYSIFQTSNHFIANILGLTSIYVHVKLPFKKSILRILLKVCLHEIRRNCVDDFWFEGSTAYHRFTSEMIAHIYFCLNYELENSKNLDFLLSCIDRQFKITLKLKNPLGLHTLIGDADGGDFNYLNNSLIMSNDPIEVSPYNIYYHYVLMKNVALTNHHEKFRARKLSFKEHLAIPQAKAVSFKFNAEDSLEIHTNENMTIVSNKYVFLVINTMKNHKYNLTHFHDDYGLVELFVNDKPVLVDTGTFSYTAETERKLRETQRYSHLDFKRNRTILENSVFALEKRYLGQMNVLDSSNVRFAVDIRIEEFQYHIVITTTDINITSNEDFLTNRQPYLCTNYLNEYKFQN